MKIYSVDTDEIYFVGDLHGDFSQINVFTHSKNLENCAIIICGDIGIGFDSDEYYRQVFNHITKTLSKRNIHVYMFRGNHDNKEFFDGNHFVDFQYIHIIPDYSIIKTPSRCILCVGGATSIDRVWRINRDEEMAMRYKRYHSCSLEEAYKKSKHSYWPTEVFVFDKEELNNIQNQGILIDTVCTHTCPSFCYPYTKDGIAMWVEKDERLSDDLHDERENCNKLLNWLKANGHNITNWYYGHFHSSYVEIVDGIKYTLLNIF